MPLCLLDEIATALALFLSDLEVAYDVEDGAGEASIYFGMVSEARDAHKERLDIIQATYFDVAVLQVCVRPCVCVVYSYVWLYLSWASVVGPQ